MKKLYVAPYPKFALFPTLMDNGEKVHFVWYWQKDISKTVCKKGKTKESVDDDHNYR